MKKNFLSLALALVAAVTLSAGVAVAQTAPAVGAKAYIPTTNKAELAFYLQNPAAQGGLAGYNLSTFEFHVGGVNFTNQVLAALGGRGSQLYVNPTATSMVGYVGGAFTGIPFANAPVMAKACLLTGECFGSTRTLRNGTCYPSTSCTSTTSPLMPAYRDSQSTTSGYGISVIPFPANQSVVLTEIAVVGNTDIGSMNGQWGYQVPRLNIWSGSNFNSAKAAFDASPLSGNVVNDMAISIANYQPFNNHFYVKYSLPQQIALPAIPGGGYHWIAVSHSRSGGISRWALKESSSASTVDFGKGWQNPVSLPLTNFGYSFGTAPVDLIGY